MYKEKRTGPRTEPWGTPLDRIVSIRQNKEEDLKRGGQNAKLSQKLSQIHSGEDCTCA